MRDSIYNIPNRLENVTKRINKSPQITPHNKELIWKFCDYCKLQGLSTLRVLFYLNRFWNIARLTDKDFDTMVKEDLERLVLAVRELKKRNGEPISERTIVDHLTAIKTFWKWLKGAEDGFPPEVKWIKAKFRGINSKLPEEQSEPIKVGKKIIKTPDSETTIEYELAVDPRTGQQQVVEHISTTKQECGRCGKYTSQRQHCTQCSTQVCGECITAFSYGYGSAPYGTHKVCKSCLEGLSKSWPG